MKDCANKKKGKYVLLVVSVFSYLMRSAIERKSFSANEMYIALKL